MEDNVVKLFGTCNPADKYNEDDGDGDRNFLLFSSSSGAAVDDDMQMDSSAMREHHDRLLPIANVGRIMKQILPPNAKISKEGKETMQECVSEFISFVTGEASDRCHKEKRKTVNGDDICWALDTLGFDNYAEPLRAYLNRYRETEGDRAGSSNTNTNKASSSSSSYIPNNNNNSYGGGGSEIADHHQPSSSPTLLKFNVIETPNQLF